MADSRKLIEYLISRDAVIKLSAARIFGKYSGYGDGLVPSVEKCRNSRHFFMESGLTCVKGLCYTFEVV